MPADLYDAKEPLLRCLQDSLAAWQAALHRVLAQSGISPDEWQSLLRLAAQARAPEVREADASAALHGLQHHEIQMLLHALSDLGWPEPSRDKKSESGKPEPLPRIHSAARLRLEKLRQAIKALQSVWVAPLSLEERGLMIACLTKMQRQLDRCAPRAHPCADGGTAPEDRPCIRYRYRSRGGGPV